MQIRMTGVKHNVEETYWGTCEMCMSEGEFDFIEFKFTDDKGNQYWLDGFYHEPWDGPYEMEIDNIPRFAGWLQEQDFPEGTILTRRVLSYLVGAYNDNKAAIVGLKRYEDDRRERLKRWWG